MKRNRYMFGVIFLIIALMLVMTGCPGKKVDKTSIKIGASRSRTGPLTQIGEYAFEPIMALWLSEVNAAGGIFIKEYNKKLPIELIVYDDKSDPDLMIRHLEKLMLEDKVDFIFPPGSTHMLAAAAPVVNKNKYLLVGAEGGASEIKELIANLPYVFASLNFSDHYQVPVLADILEKEGVKTVGIGFINDNHGYEYSNTAVSWLGSKGINVSMVKNFPFGAKDADLRPIITEAKAANVDAFLCMAYPDENFTAINISMEIGFNPKVFLIGPGGNFEFFSQIYGKAAEGVMCWGAWNEKSSPGHKELAIKLTDKLGRDKLDWWGHNLYYASLQFWQQAVEMAGSLDQEAIRKIFETKKLDTILGPTWYDSSHLLAVDCHAGELGQWQNGVFEVIGPTEKATAKVLYPKPSWPQKE